MGLIRFCISFGMNVHVTSFRKGVHYWDGLKEEEAISVLHHGYKGMTFLDTSNAYGPYQNENIPGKVL